jgi:hypothetical protein
MCKAVEIGKRGDVLRYHPGSKNECVITFLDNFIFFRVPSMKNIILNIL